MLKNWKSGKGCSVITVPSPPASLTEPASLFSMPTDTDHQASCRQPVAGDPAASV